MSTSAAAYLCPVSFPLTVAPPPPPAAQAGASPPSQEATPVSVRGLGTMGSTVLWVGLTASAPDHATAPVHPHDCAPAPAPTMNT